MAGGRLSRRSLLAGTAAGAAASGPAAHAAGPRPNILWLVSEDNNPYVGAYGDRLAHTPTIDRLAAGGVRFANAFSTAPVCAPSRFALITGAYPETCAPAQHMRAVARLPASWRATPQVLRDAGYFCTNNAKTDYNCDLDPAAIWDEHGGQAHWRARPPGKPFFSVFNFGATHESQVFRPTPGRVKPQDVRVPGHLPDTPEVRQDIASYYNLMERMDGELARRLAELAADGLAEDTIVFYFADNGGVLPRSKRYCHDAGLRVPLVVLAPPKWAHLLPAAPGGTVERAVSLIDLPPTVLALAGATPPPQMQGAALFGTRAPAAGRHAFGMRGRMDEVYDLVRTVTDGRWRYIRNYMPHLAAGRHGAYEWQSAAYRSLETEHLAGRLTPAARRFFEPRPYEELYDLRADPDELENLAASPRAAGVLARLRRALDAHMLAIHDNGFIPEGSSLEGFAESRAPGAYPLARIMALAATAAQRDAKNLPALRRGLADDNEVIRYWSALGIAMLAPAAAGGARAEAEARSRIEPSPQVRVALAAAIGASAPGTAAMALARLLDEAPAPRVRLQALNALEDLGQGAAPALPAVRRALAAGGDEYIRSAARRLELRLTGRYRPDSLIFGG
ncbi:MAG: sulfatase [Phenylobacterium sp.]|uniref:sulfatase family protein n=1 Tax=Phenylobacterium sp. TaxID=1871053 RepID=UPI001A47CFD2|nr:sulfatase [Phenylobacterium sp.]MBL8770520.1 sulfatase [Phenylobacterium sp.]